MKRIISIIVASVFIVVGLYRPMLAFALQNDIQISQKSPCCIEKNFHQENLNNQCVKSCYVQWIISIGNLDGYQGFQKQILKKRINFTNIDLLSSQDFSVKKEELIYQKSPPNHSQEIVNYAYHTLIKIIKSNT